MEVGHADTEEQEQNRGRHEPSSTREAPRKLAPVPLAGPGTGRPLRSTLQRGRVVIGGLAEDS